MNSNYQSYKNKIELPKLKKLISDKKITRQQMILFLNKEKEKVFKTESDADIIARINKGFGLDYVTHLLPKIRVKGEPKKLTEMQKNHKKIDEKYKQTTKFKLLTTQQEKAFINKGINSIVNTKYTIFPIPFTVTNADFITKGCLNLLNSSKKAAQSKHEGGFNMFMKLVLNDVVFDDDSKATQYRSFIIKGIDITYAEIYNKIFNEASKMYDTPNYCLTLHAVDIVISPLAVKAGCNPTKCYKSDQIQKSKHEKIKLKSLPSITVCLHVSITGSMLKVTQ